MARRVFLLLSIVALGCGTDTGSDPGGGGAGGTGGGGATAWAPAFDADSVGWLLSAWGTGADDLYTVGGSMDKGALMHKTATGWAAVDLPANVPLLNWVTGFGSDDIVLVGNGGTVVRGKPGSWTVQTTPTTENLWGVWGASKDDLWAVGGRGLEAGQQTILRWNGTEWSKVDPPTLQKPAKAFFKVWGSSANDVWIVGQSGAVLHWDGTALEEKLVGASVDLIAVWGTGPDRVAMVGGRNNGILVRWDGTAFKHTELSPLPGLNGVWMRKPTTIHAVGVNGTAIRIDFDSAKVTEYPLDDVLLDLHGVFGDPDGNLISVGGNFLAASVDGYKGVAISRKLGTAE